MMEHFASTLIVISLAVYNTGALNCSYELLEKSLLTQQNKYELSRAFFPPIANPPEFVTVNYSFLEINQNKIWHWSVFTSGFIHPPEVLQYMSLFFGKPHAFYNGSIHLTLEKTTSETIADCAEDLQKMQLLTQRLQLYATQQTMPLKVDVNYKAKAFIANKGITASSLKVTVEDSIKDTLSAVVIAPVVVIVPLAIILIIIIIMIYTIPKEKRKLNNALRSKIPLVCALAIISPTVTLYNLILSGLSLCTWTRNNQLPYYDIYNHSQERNFTPTIFLIAIDTLCLLWCIVVTIWSSNQACHKSTAKESNFRSCCNTKSQKNTANEYELGPTPKPSESGNAVGHKEIEWYVVLSLIVIGPIVSIISHSPYIAIAYLDDAHHAGSIFIYYTIVLCLAYSICWITFHTCISYQSCMCYETRETCCCQCRKSYRFLIVTLGMCGLGTFLAMIGTTSVYFIIIPINKSISDAPNRLVGIYQSGGFLIGAFVLYKLIGFFYHSKQKNLEKAVTKWTETLNDKKSDTPWSEKTDNEKLERFYNAIIDMVWAHSKEIINPKKEKKGGDAVETPLTGASQLLTTSTLQLPSRGALQSPPTGSSTDISQLQPTACATHSPSTEETITTTEN